MSEGEGRKGRRLSSDDMALWDGVTRSVRPLRKRAPRVEAQAESKEPPPKAAKRVIASRPTPSVPAPLPKKAPPPPVSLDRKTRQKISRGRDAIDARLDLHGHTQAEAHDVLLRFLRRTQAKGGRVVLVITGKGARHQEGRGNTGGVLKRAVPLWLALPEFRDLVIGFDSAAAPHGGEGALYVRLRKARESLP